MTLTGKRHSLADVVNNCLLLTHGTRRCLVTVHGELKAINAKGQREDVTADNGDY